ncbi:Dynein light chain, type 1/2 [Dillenia turbinata]|uniref:Dynein light chain, type 1/2 n=1 Tax=Dillenia turbinata TaxID=194707 RepID=A0AAN8Z192_9MAGN
MAPHTNRRQNLAPPNPKSPTPPPATEPNEPSLEKHPKTQPQNTTNNNPSKFSHSKPSTEPQTTFLAKYIDTHLQGKAMTLSLIDPSDKKVARRKEKEKKIMMTAKAEFEGKSESNEWHYYVNRSLRGSIAAAAGTGRRSFCDPHGELVNFLNTNGAKVMSVDMPPFMQLHAVDCARKALDSLEKFTSKTLAFTLKKEFDKVYGPAWHCIVGTSFGSFVTHSAKGFMYFSMDHKMYILLFKTTVQRAD